MSTAIAAALYFDRELAANPEPLVTLVETLMSLKDICRQWRIPLVGKGGPPCDFNLKKLVGWVTNGNSYSVGVETAKHTSDSDTLFMRFGTTPLAKNPRTLTQCRYEATIAIGGRRRVDVEPIVKFADSVAVRAGAIVVADTAEYARALASISGGSNLTAAQNDRITDGLYWQPRWGDVIRGPAWGTFLSSQHVAKLGGMTRIERESGCTRVIALGSGGAYLQATPEPIDAVPETLERFLEPVRHP